MERTVYFGLCFNISRELTPLQVRALRVIVIHNGRSVTLDALVDELIVPPGQAGRHAATKVTPSLRTALNRLAEENTSVIEAGPLGPIGGHGYKLTALAVKMRRRDDE